jgi:leader peptidase (prepilin peptidase) / N-methyltransferase
VDLALAVIAFAPGLAFGSFLNVLAARVPLKRSIISPPSACMDCGHEIAWYDNIPLLSWLVLRGRCRECGTSISIRYFLVELVTGLLVASCFLKFGFSGDAFVASFVCLALVTISAVDFERMIIPNRIVVPAALATLAANTALHPSPRWALAGLAASAFLFAAALLYPKGMGMGDVKLAVLVGAALGRTTAVGLMAGMVAALLPSLFLFARHGAAARKMKIPFGPFLALGCVVALFAGHPILDWYWGLSR